MNTPNTTEMSGHNLTISSVSIGMVLHMICRKGFKYLLWVVFIFVRFTVWTISVRENQGKTHIITLSGRWIVRSFNPECEEIEVKLFAIWCMQLARSLRYAPQFTEVCVRTVAKLLSWPQETYHPSHLRACVQSPLQYFTTLLCSCQQIVRCKWKVILRNKTKRNETKRKRKIRARIYIFF